MDGERSLPADFWNRRPLIGMVHLAALPGSVGEPSSGMSEVIDRAISDAHALQAGGADAVMVENFFDAPFPRTDSPPHTIAAMTLAVAAVQESVCLPVGVNVLRNDVCAALGIATVCGGAFVRVNVYVGAGVTDQGIIEGAARQALLYRQSLVSPGTPSVAIWADIFVKHAVPLGGGDIADVAHDATARGRAQALIVSGTATGRPVRREDLQRVRMATPDTPVLIGSGLTAENASELLEFANGAIVGTGLKRDGNVAAPVDPDRVRAVRKAMSSRS